MVAVVFSLEDQNANPLEGITVRAYDEDNEVLQDSQVTDAAGDATFNLAAGVYWARFYPAAPQLTIASPQRFTVVAVGSNTFDIVGQLFVRPTSPYAHMCTISGFFVDGSGRPQADLVLHVVSRWEPSSLGAPAAEPAPLGYFNKTLRLVTDENGYVQFDLARGTTVNAILAGFEDQPVTVEVPDAYSADVVDWLFPQAVSLTFVPAGPLVMAVGDSQALNPQLLLSSGIVLDKDTENLPSEFIDFASSDSSIVTVSLQNGEVILHAVASGAVTVTGTVKEDVFPERLPAPTFTATPVVVTVP